MEILKSWEWLGMEVWKLPPWSWGLLEVENVVGAPSPPLILVPHVFRPSYVTGSKVYKLSQKNKRNK